MHQYCLLFLLRATIIQGQGGDHMVKKQSSAEAIPQILQKLQSNQPCALWITGTSMVPFLRSEKDAVLLKAFDGTAQKGDILLFRRPNGQYVLHRVHKITTNGNYHLCGDNQTSMEPVAPEQILAIVTQIQRKGRKFPSSHWLWVLLSKLWMVYSPCDPFYCPSCMACGKS
jgi:SOS-response transcriptional repressor LexA